MNDYERLWDTLPLGVERCVLGTTLLGREIPLITLGKGERAVLYVAGVEGTDAPLSRVLLAFIKEYAMALEKRAPQYGYPMEELFSTRCIYILPMLNPDGACYASEGVGAENPLFERVCAMNGGNTDFSTWCANARGVELSRNFASGFAKAKREEALCGIMSGAPAGFGGEYPESEPESAALCRFLRARHSSLQGVIELKTGIRKGIRCSCADNLTAKCMATGRVLSRFTGLPFWREDMGATGALTDFCVRTLSRPAFELHCATPGEQTSLTALYASLRRVLFSFPYIL